MKELLKKKSGNKGFTLAELLVVIAILAILIAIAVPVFSGMVAEANLRVNQANVRSVRSAAVAHILTNLDEYDYSGATYLNEGLQDGWCWAAIAAVDNSGDVSELRVYALPEPAEANATYNGIFTSEPVYAMPSATDDEAYDFYPLSDDVTSTFATLRPTSGTDKVYWVQAQIMDLDQE